MKTVLSTEETAPAVGTLNQLKKSYLYGEVSTNNCNVGFNSARRYGAEPIHIVR
jgi:hypothetical protein